MGYASCDGNSLQHALGEAFAAGTGFIVRIPAGESVLAPDAAFIRKERLSPDLPDYKMPDPGRFVLPDGMPEPVRASP